MSMCWDASAFRRLLGLTLLTAWGTLAAADVLHLDNGNKIEGQIRSEDDTHYVVRTYQGEVRIEKTSVVEIERGPTPFDEYDRRLADMADSPEGNYELAVWCAENKLVRERSKHLARALEINLHYEPARTALGYVKVDGAWLEARNTARTPRRVAEDEAREAERQARSTQRQWEQRLREIINTQFAGRDTAAQQHGRDLLLAIDDPLALVPLFDALTSCRITAARLALVDAIADYPGDEATEYLVVAALEDQFSGVSERAYGHLVERDRRHAVVMLRLALREGRGWVKRRAATVLAKYDAVEAIPDLIDSLTGSRRKSVVYSRYVGVVARPRLVRDYLEHGYAYVLRTRYEDYETRGQRAVVQRVVTERVTVYRNEVRDALKELTGVDFGFDANEWSVWYDANRERFAAEEEEMISESESGATEDEGASEEE